MDTFNNWTRSQRMMQVCRDSALAGVLNDLAKMECDMRPFQRSLDAAISNALIQYSAMMQVEINRIDADEERRISEAMLQAPRIIVADTPEAKAMWETMR